MTYIHFIVNPISGNGKHIIEKTELEKHFPTARFKIEVDYSNYRKHAIDLTRKAVEKNPHCIVACGGDGTINEVASCLVHTKIKLGIIPVGSGNGLASNLSIPKKIGAACEIIKNGNYQSIDVGKLNEHYFFSNIGVGIDAMIIKKYEAGKKRTLFAYICASIISSFQYKPIPAILTFNRKMINLNFFLLFISNSNEMGYGMSLTPKASLTDGWLDLVRVSELNFLDKLVLGVRVLTNKAGKFSCAKHELIQNLKVEMPLKIFLDAQIDGEYYNLKTNIVEVAILKEGLDVLMN